MNFRSIQSLLLLNYLTLISVWSCDTTSTNTCDEKLSFKIGSKILSLENPTYFIAELSCNHHGSFEEAMKLVRLAKESGADAIKTQTYTGDTITLKCDNEHFKLKNTSWDNKNTLWELFNEASTPWEWNKLIKEESEKLGMDFLSSPFDETAVEHLEELNVTAYKIASMEIIDIPLLKKIARTKKPVIVSTGMASLAEIEEAVNVLKQHGTTDILLLKCTSAYPARPADANLKTIEHLSKTFEVLSGLSDHTLGITVPIVAYSFGARLIEKHFISNRTNGGPDSAFSLEPSEFKEMVNSIRIAEQAIGHIHYGGVKGEVRIFRRSLFVVKDMKKGDIFIEGENIRSIRPGDGLHSRFLWDIIGRQASKDIKYGTPLSWNLVE